MEKNLKVNRIFSKSNKKQKIYGQRINYIPVKEINVMASLLCADLNSFRLSLRINPVTSDVYLLLRIDLTDRIFQLVYYSFTSWNKLIKIGNKLNQICMSILIMTYFLVEMLFLLNMFHTIFFFFLLSS